MDAAPSGCRPTIWTAGFCRPQTKACESEHRSMQWGRRMGSVALCPMDHDMIAIQSECMEMDGSALTSCPHWIMTWSRSKLNVWE